MLRDPCIKKALDTVIESSVCHSKTANICASTKGVGKESGI